MKPSGESFHTPVFQGWVVKISTADFHRAAFCLAVRDKACLFTKISFIGFETRLLK